jgi:hypothetical protein
LLSSIRIGTQNFLDTNTRVAHAHGHARGRLSWWHLADSGARTPGRDDATVGKL